MEIEGGSLNGLLLVAGQAREAVGEGVGDAEFHKYSNPGALVAINALTTGRK